MKKPSAKLPFLEIMVWFPERDWPRERLSVVAMEILEFRMKDDGSSSSSSSCSSGRKLCGFL